MDDRGVVMRVERVGTCYVRRVTQRGLDGIDRDISIETGKFRIPRFRIADFGTVIDLHERAARDHT